MATDSLHFHTASYSDWIEVFRRLELEAPVKCTGYALASYADWKTGKDAYPGLRELATATGYRSHHTLTDALDVLRRRQLVSRQSSGSKSGRRGNADVYWLSLTDRLRSEAGVDLCACGKKAS